MRRLIVCYIPVIHEGYLSFIKRHQPAKVALVTPQFLRDLDQELAEILARDIRAINPKTVLRCIPNAFILQSLDVLKKYDHFIFPLEDISKVIINAAHLSNVSLDSTFLRWDWSKTKKPITVDGKYKISHNKKDQAFMSLAQQEVQKSSDFWRQVGAVLPITDSHVLTAFNRHDPDSLALYAYGDPRLYMNPGEEVTICTAIHAEASIIGQAASKGYALHGKSIYVTTFPCPACTRLIIEAGIKKVFFKEGYSRIDGEEIFKKANVEIFQVV